MPRRTALVLFFWVAFSAQSLSSENLASQNLSSRAALSAVCSGCHAESGRSLSGLNTTDINKALKDYRQQPGTTVMHRIMRGYDADDIALISAYLTREVP